MSVSGSAPGLYALDPLAPADYLRRMTLHFSQMGFTEGLTFMMLNLLLVGPGAYLERQVMRPFVRS